MLCRILWPGLKDSELFQRLPNSVSNKNAAMHIMKTGIRMVRLELRLSFQLPILLLSMVEPAHKRFEELLDMMKTVFDSFQSFKISRFPNDELLPKI